MAKPKDPPYVPKHRKIKCGNCNGKGYIIVPGTGRVTCGVCNGKGEY